MRISFILISLLFWSKIEAQNLDSARHLWQRNELGRALDLILNDTVHNEAVYLLKAKIYQSISVDAKYKDLVADPKNEAFDVLQTIFYAFNANSLITDSTAYKIYEGYTNDGVAFFNAGTEKQDKADYARALKNLNKAAAVRGFIRQYQSLPALDTTNLLYSAKAAIYAGDQRDAVYYSKKIADNSLAGTYFEPVYRWLLYYCNKNFHEKELDKYSAITEKLYPKSDYYLLNYIDFYRSLGDAASLVETYTKLFRQDFNKTEYHLAYIKDLFNYSFGEDTGKARISYGSTTITESVKYLNDKLINELKLFTKANPLNAEGKLLFGKYYINKAVDLQNEKGKNISSKDLKIVADGAQTNKDVKVNLQDKIPGINISNLLVKSNIYLKEVADKLGNRVQRAEATKLLIANYTTLKRSDQVKKYKSRLKVLTNSK